MCRTVPRARGADPSISVVLPHAEASTILTRRSLPAYILAPWTTRCGWNDPSGHERVNGTIGRPRSRIRRVRIVSPGGRSVLPERDRAAGDRLFLGQHQRVEL